MRRLVVYLVLWLFTGQASAQVANEVDVQTAALVKLEADDQRLDKLYQDKNAEVDRLKAQKTWTAQNKVPGALQAANEVRIQLEKRDADVRAAKAALLAAIDRELAGEPDDARRAALSKQRAALAPVQPIAIPDENIAPTDDAEDLEFKAGALAQSEAKLAAEGQKLEASLALSRKQVALTKSRKRADDQDVFHDEQPRRPGATHSGATAGDRNPAEAGAGGGITAGPTPAPPAGQTDGTAGDTDKTTAFAAADPAVVLANVVEPATLDDLKRAERSADPETRAKAAERALKEVQALSARVHQRRVEMEKRAGDLRKQP